MGMQPNYKGKYYRKVITYQSKKYYIVASSERELMRKVVEKEDALKRGDIVVNENTTVEKWFETWLEVDKLPTVKESTYNNIKTIMSNNVITHIGKLKIGDVKRTNLQYILNSYAGKSFSLVSKIKIYVCDMFDAAERDEIIDKNPARFLKLPEFTKGTARVMTKSEYDASIELCRTHRAGLWIMTMLRCGLRRGETIPLVWSDIDFDNKTLTVNKAVEFINDKPKLSDTPKSVSGIRTIKIPDDLFAMYKEAYKKIKGFLIFTPENSDTMLSRTQVTRLWKSFKRELDIALDAELYRNKIIKTKIDGLKIHSLRHTAITKLVESGAEVKDVQLFAGHSNVQTTLNIYAQVNKGKAAERIVDIQNQKGGILSGTKAEKA